MVRTILRVILLAAMLALPAFAAHAAGTITVYKDAS
jgi:hypothetical protein